MYLNSSAAIGMFLTNATTTMTGDMFLTLLLLIIIIVGVAAMFGIPMEFTAIFVIPLLIAYLVQYGGFVPIISLIVIYLGIILTKNWLFK